MPFPCRKSFKTLRFSRFLATALLCSLAVNLTAQEQPASSQHNDSDQEEKSEVQSAPDVAQSSPQRETTPCNSGLGI